MRLLKKEPTSQELGESDREADGLSVGFGLFVGFLDSKKYEVIPVLSLYLNEALLIQEQIRKKKESWHPDTLHAIVRSDHHYKE